MNIFYIRENSYSSYPPTAAMIGAFDGLHRGHQKLIENTLQQARARDIESAAILFDPDPDVLFTGKKHTLLSLDDRIALAQAFGFDNLYICSFTKDFAALDIEQFHAFLKNLNILVLIYGFDFTYGKGAKGNAKTLLNQDEFDTLEIYCLSQDERKISSTRIRKDIEEGKMKTVCSLLGYCYSIPGKIVTGFQRGSRLLGFPTANLKPSGDYLIPRKGVYAGHVLIENKAWPAMINVGINPTFNNEEKTIEAHIFDFDKDIYGKQARFFFEFFLRDEIAFSGIDSLKAQLEQDEKQVLELHKSLQKQWDLTCRLWRIEQGGNGII